MICEADLKHPKRVLIPFSDQMHTSDERRLVDSRVDLFHPPLLSPSRRRWRFRANVYSFKEKANVASVVCVASV